MSSRRSYPFNDHGKSLIMEAKGWLREAVRTEVRRNSGRPLRRPVGAKLIHEIVRGPVPAMTVQKLADDAALSSDPGRNLELFRR